jgi:hypothetical protein
VTHYPQHANTAASGGADYKLRTAEGEASFANRACKSS